MAHLHYSYPVDTLTLGASLGNPTAWATLDPFTDLKGLWNAADNLHYAGEWTLTFDVDGRSLGPAGTVFTPASQMTTFSGHGLRVEKTFFIPFAAAGRSEPPVFCKAAIMLIRVFNDGDEEQQITCRHRLVFPAVPNDLFTKQPPPAETQIQVDVRKDERICRITTESHPFQARVFGSQLAWSRCSADNRSLDVNYLISVEGDGGVKEAAFVLAFSEEGEGTATSVFNSCQDAQRLLKLSDENYGELLARSEVFTPSAVINRGLQWAKVNTLRVQHRYRGGLAFTNDPPQDIVVIRDLGWYVFGADYLTPDFCAGLLHYAEQYGYHEGGKLTEFLHADEIPPEQHDYKLNINDDSPLFIEALYHHAVTCLNDADLARVYGFMRRAAEWILSQISDGLVRCTSTGTSVWGICCWRNIIEGYNLSGAVTEINAECYHALLVTGKVARRLGRTDEADRFASAAEALKNAMNSLLVSERTRLYLLNLGIDGARHHDVTGDLIFPVLFEVADPERRDAILKALTTKEMWTSWGARTVHPMESNYDPEFGYQLVGGVWPNLTAWISFCHRKDHPDLLVEGMTNIYKGCEPKNPADAGKVVPGEFPERFHGERNVSLGMPLSPWTPPTYLWLGIEGLLGVTPTLSDLELNPSIPDSWEWIAVRNLLYRGENIDAFLFGGTLYATKAVTTAFPIQVGDRVKCTCKGDHIFALAMRTGVETVLFVCTDDGGSATVKVEMGTTVIKKEITLERGGASLIRLGAV
jgi:hypothetical protein